MAERTIKMTAMALAGEFYEQKRSDRFRSKDSLVKAKRLQEFSDGTIREVTVLVPFLTAYPDAHKFAISHWPMFYDTARKCLLTMLAMSDSRVPPHRKEEIMAAITEDRDLQLAGGGKSLVQAHMGDHHGG